MLKTAWWRPGSHQASGRGQGRANWEMSNPSSNLDTTKGHLVKLGMSRGSPSLCSLLKSPKGPFMIHERFLFWLCSTHFRDSMQISLWPTAIISENQTFDRSTFNFFKNSIFSACYYCYLFKCVDGGVGGRVMFALAWQPVANWIPLTARHGSSDSHVARNGFSPPVCRWLMVGKRLPTPDLTLSILFLLSGRATVGANRCNKFTSHPVKSAFFDLLASFWLYNMLIIIKANISWNLSLIPSTL